ncbi:MAG: hypothetical protein ISQ51_06385 [Synechococcus sp. BS307-5m-G37]|nr:hypothetical protein [Synechococcus sp. BS307-5m-G37]
MTNLSPDQSVWRRRFSRGRILVGAPAAFGVVLAGALFAGLAWPRLGVIEEQRQRMDDLKAKEASLPQLKLQRTKTQVELQKAQQQQSLLIELVAGQGEIDTFLAQLSRESAATGVTITLYEPVAAVSADAPSEATNKASKPGQTQGKGNKQAAPKDPLAKLGYQKTAVLLQAEGPYPGLLAFLRRMEALKLLVQPSDLELVAIDDASQASDEDDQQPAGPPRTQLKLKFTFFDKSAEPVEPKEESAPS